MNKYDQLDALILKAIALRKSPIYFGPCDAEARRIAAATGRDSFRVIDGRLQALRKLGRVKFLTKAQANGSGGWKIVGLTTPTTNQGA